MESSYRQCHHKRWFLIPMCTTTCTTHETSRLKSSCVKDKNYSTAEITTNHDDQEIPTQTANLKWLSIMQGKLLWNFTSTKLHSTHTPNPVFSVTDIQPKENKFWRKENLGYFKAMWRMNWHKRCPTGAYKYRSRILSEIDQSLYLREHFLFRVKQEHNQQIQHDLLSHITSFSKSNQIYKYNTLSIVFKFRFVHFTWNTTICWHFLAQSRTSAKF